MNFVLLVQAMRLLATKTVRVLNTKLKIATLVLFVVSYLNLLMIEHIH